MVQVCVFLALIPGCARGIAPLPYTLETCNPPRQGVQRHAGTGYIGNGRKASWAAQLVSNPQKACRPKPGGAMAKLLAIVARGGEETLQWPRVALRGRPTGSSRHTVRSRSERSEERRVGKESVGTGRTRWRPA